jgi:transposase-like protein
MKTIELEVQDLMNSKKPQIKQTRRGGKRAPNDDLCTASEAASIVGVPSSTFQNYVRDNRVERVVPEGKKEGYYPRDQVLRLAEELRKNPPKRRQRSKQTASIKQALEPAIRNEAATAWIQHADELRAYDLDCELYGFENAVSPDITWPWWQKNPHACMILYNKEDRQDIWGLISIIPMEEEIIFKLLREEMNERDIRPEHVLTYETGRHYSCYVAAVSMKPQHRHSFTMLLRSVMQYWCKHPDIYIDKLFAFALGGEGSSGMHLIRK